MPSGLDLKTMKPIDSDADEDIARKAFATRRVIRHLQDAFTAIEKVVYASLLYKSTGTFVVLSYLSIMLKIPSIPSPISFT